MVEYGLIIALIAIVVIVALALLGPKIRDIFDKTNDALDTAEAGGEGAGG
jgi:pilus assembly protein Flp/PilA